jgi:hypothetical protein
MSVTKGVFPVHNNVFKIGIKGLESEEADMQTPAGLENFSPSFDNTIEDWFSMENKGWRSSLLTGKEYNHARIFKAKCCFYSVKPL